MHAGADFHTVGPNSYGPLPHRGAPVSAALELGWKSLKLFHQFLNAFFSQFTHFTQLFQYSVSL